ncbi:MAG: hypothetical protein EBU07_00990 [Betaproteobacteria bacterium]|nr:hypothetical protein [Betaproteobacteria bacterium]
MPTTSISSNRVVVEGRQGQKTKMQFVVQLSGAATTDVSIDYRTEDSSKDNAALGTVDYTPVSGTLVIPKGRAIGVIEVEVLGDSEFEGDEVFNMVLFNPVGTSFSKGDSLTVEGTIKDDEPIVSITDATLVEGQEGDTRKMLFTLRLSTPASQEVTLNYATQGSSKLNAATDGPGEDYISTSGSLTIPAGRTMVQIPVTILGDDLREGDEVFELVLSDLVGAGFAKGETMTAIGTITDDEPVITVSDAKLMEGNSGNAKMQFVVKLAAPVDHPVSFNYRTEDAAVSNTAVAGTDYTGVSGSITIGANKTTAFIDVPIIGNTAAQTDRVFKLVLTDAQGAGFAKGDIATATGTIVDDDPIITVADAKAVEAGTGDITKVQFRVTLSEPSSQEVSLKYKTVESTAGNAAVQGTDYAAATGTLKIPAGRTSGIIEVSIIGDTVREGDEVFSLVLSDATNAAFAKGDSLTLTGTIRDDEPLLAVNSPSVVEGRAGATGKMVFMVQLSSPATTNVTVKYQTQDATDDNAATQGEDYTASQGSITIPRGWTTGMIEVPILGDGIYEGDEALNLVLYDVVGAGFPSGFKLTASGTIKDDEPLISATDMKVTEGARGAVTKMVFPIRLSNAALQDVTFKYETVQSTGALVATPGKDFTSVSGTLTIPKGSTMGYINVDILDDTLSEGSETFNLVLSNPVGGAFAKGEQLVIVGTIVDNEPTVGFG